MLYLFIVAGSHRPLGLMEAKMNQKSSCLKIEIITVAAILLSFDLMLLVTILSINIFVRIPSVLIAFHEAAR
jgi:hypothetical protein